MRAGRRLSCKTVQNILNKSHFSLGDKPKNFSGDSAGYSGSLFLQRRVCRNLNALPTTDTEWNLIAAAAMTGLR